jgi:hypothetical protein
MATWAAAAASQNSIGDREVATRRVGLVVADGYGAEVTDQ